MRKYISDETTLGDLALLPLTGVQGRAVVEASNVKGLRDEIRKSNNCKQIVNCNYVLHPIIHSLQLGNFIRLLLPTLGDDKVSPIDLSNDLYNAELLFDVMGFTQPIKVIQALLALKGVARNLPQLVTIVSCVSLEVEALIRGKPSKLKMRDLIPINASLPSEIPSEFQTGTFLTEICEIFLQWGKNKAFVWVTNEALCRLIEREEIRKDVAFNQVIPNRASRNWCLNSKSPTMKFSFAAVKLSDSSLLNTFKEKMTSTVNLSWKETPEAAKEVGGKKSGKTYGHQQRTQQQQQQQRQHQKGKTQEKKPNPNDDKAEVKTKQGDDEKKKESIYSITE